MGLAFELAWHSMWHTTALSIRHMPHKQQHWVCCWSTLCFKALLVICKRAICPSATRHTSSSTGCVAGAPYNFQSSACRLHWGNEPTCTCYMHSSSLSAGSHLAPSCVCRGAGGMGATGVTCTGVTRPSAHAASTPRASSWCAKLIVVSAGVVGMGSNRSPGPFGTGGTL